MDVIFQIVSLSLSEEREKRAFIERLKIMVILGEDVGTETNKLLLVLINNC